jgi:hypothetical protein
VNGQFRCRDYGGNGEWARRLIFDHPGRIAAWLKEWDISAPGNENTNRLVGAFLLKIEIEPLA